MPSLRRRPLLLAAGLLLAGYFLAWNLAALELGRADNGDFLRFTSHWLAKPQGFAVNWPTPDDPAHQRRFFTCWLRRWEFQPQITKVPPREAGTTAFFWVAAFVLDYLFSPGKVFDLLWLGWLLRLVCLALLLVFYALTASSLRGRSWLLPVVISAPVFLCLSDPRFTTFFNSFYRDPGTLIYALLTLCGILALAGRRFGWAVAATALGGSLLSGSAPAHFFTAFLAAGALAAGGYRWWSAPRPASQAVRRPAERFGLGLLVAALLGAGVLSECLAEPNMRQVNAYHSLFIGVLLVSDHPEAHLAHLGLPREALQRINRHAFHPDSLSFIQENSRRLTHLATAKTLLYEPVLLPRMLRRGADMVNPTVPEGAFLHVADEGCDQRKLPSPWWTEGKARYLPKGLLLVALLAGGAVTGLVSLRSPDPWVFAVGLALAFGSLAALGEVAVSVFGDGFGDLQHHLLAASFFVDAVLALLLWRLTLLWGSGTRPHGHGSKDHTESEAELATSVPDRG